MATLTLQSDSPGAGGRRPVNAYASRALQLATYTMDFDSSYPTGGEDISAIWSDFKEVVGIYVQAHDITIADNRMFVPDLTNKKLIMFTAINTEATNASNQSAVTGVRLLVYGYA